MCCLLYITIDEKYTINPNVTKVSLNLALFDAHAQTYTYEEQQKQVNTFSSLKQMLIHFLS